MEKVQRSKPYKLRWNSLVVVGGFDVITPLLLGSRRILNPSSSPAAMENMGLHLLWAASVAPVCAQP